MEPIFIWIWKFRFSGVQEDANSYKYPDDTAPKWVQTIFSWL